MPRCLLVMALLGAVVPFSPLRSQTPPSASQVSAYHGLHAAAGRGSDEIRALVQASADLNAQDSNGALRSTLRRSGAWQSCAGIDPTFDIDPEADAEPSGSARVVFWP